MSEICLECWRKISDEREPGWKYILSREFDLCEECGEWKRVIVRERFIQLKQAVEVAARIVQLPCLIWREIHK